MSSSLKGQVDEVVNSTPKPGIKLTVAIVAAPAEAQLINECLANLDQLPLPTHEFIMLDDATELPLQQQLSGEYVSFLRACDVPLPSHFERKIAALDQHPDIGLVYSRWLEIYGTEEDWPDPEFLFKAGVAVYPAGLTPYSYVGTRDEVVDLIPGNYIPLSSMILRRSVLEAIGTVKLELCGAYPGWELALTCCRHTKTSYISDPLLTVRQEKLTPTAAIQQKLAVWRRRLVEDGEAPTVSGRTWGLMRDRLQSDLGQLESADKGPAESWLHELEFMETQYLERLGQRFGRRTRYLPSPQPVTARATLPESDEGRPTVAADPAIVWCGPPFDPGDHGADLRGLVLASLASGLLTRVEPVLTPNTPVYLSDNQKKMFDDLNWRALPGNARVMQIWHGPTPYFSPDRQSAGIVGRAAFPMAGLSQEWIEWSDQLDFLWVPTDFSRDAFVRSGMSTDKVKVLPPCVDPEFFRENTPPVALNTGRTFNFLAFIEWTPLTSSAPPLSGWDVLIRAWARAFRTDDDVALVLVAHAHPSITLQEISEAVHRLMTEETGGQSVAPIQLQAGWPAHPSLPSLYAAANAYVQPSRAEAWGRQSIEAMASGLAVIGTRWGAHLDFMNDQNSFLLDCRLVESATSENEPHGWAEPSVEQLADLMREVREHQDATRQRGVVARAQVAGKLNPREIGSILQELCF